MPRPTYRLLASAALLAAVWFQIDGVAMARSWPPARGLDVAAGAALSLVGLAIQWRKWHRLLVAVRPGSAPGESLRSLLGGFSLGLLSPGRVGELGRGLFLPDRRVPASAAALCDRATSFGVTVVLGLAGLAVSEPRSALAAASGLAVALTLGWVIGRRPRTWRWTRLEATRRHLTRAVVALRDIGPRGWGRAAAWSLAFNAVFLAQFYLFVRAWGPVPLSLLPYIPAIFAAKAVLPIGFGDLGPREAAAVFIFSRLGLDPMVGLNAALLIFVTNVVAPALAGAAAAYLPARQPVRADAAPGLRPQGASNQWT
ncbi:MAG: lysylphosphatidylglycerol synthase domain-containing protein [Gemmatimonadota bacterium]